jgi:hypothetical protein
MTTKDSSSALRNKETGDHLDISPERIAWALFLGRASAAWAGSVGLPAPAADDHADGRPGEGRVEVAISGEHLDEARGLVFSDPRIAAKRSPARR